MERPDDRIEVLEERLAHLLRAVDDLSDVVARQEREIALLTRRVQMLMQREGEREAQGMREVPIDRPPHW
jgi:SlyX protein